MGRAVLHRHRGRLRLGGRHRHLQRLPRVPVRQLRGTTSPSAAKLFGSDPNATQPEINATFNINLGQPGCLTGTFFYLGLDNNHGTNVDLVTVLEHEFAHGLGFQTFTNAQTGAFRTPASPAIYDRFLMDNSNGKSWVQMTNAERAASSINTHKLVWNGPQVQADVPTVLSPSASPA